MSLGKLTERLNCNFSSETKFVYILTGLRNKLHLKYIVVGPELQVHKYRSEKPRNFSKSKINQIYYFF